jgi:HlyD family secretion protein
VATPGTQQQLWLLRDGQPVAMAVTVGATDGRVTEILAGDLQAGAEVITDSSGPGAQ